MFKNVFSHPSEVLVLDGGFPAWKSVGGRVEKDVAPKRWTKSTYTVSSLPDKKGVIASFDDVKDFDRVCVLDARPAQRFLGKAQEPRPTLHIGHAPGAINIPWNSFHRDPARPELGFKQGDELRSVLAPALQLDGKKQLVSSCGSGISAALINFAFEELNLPPIALYDGSWAEYGNKKDAIVEK